MEPNLSWNIFNLILKGLFAENKEKLINNTLNSLKDFDPPANCTSELLEHEFHVLRRLIASKAGYKAFTTLPKYLTFFRLLFLILVFILNKF